MYTGFCPIFVPKKKREYMYTNIRACDNNLRDCTHVRHVVE